MDSGGGSDGRCSIFASFPSLDSTLYRRVTVPDVGLIVSSDGWASLRERHGETEKLTIEISGAVEYDQFWDDDARIFEDFDETGAFISANYWQGDLADRLMTSIAFGDGLSVKVGRVEVANLSLDGSLDAIKAMIGCLDYMRANDPDPFD